MNEILYEATFEWHSSYYGAGIVFVVALIFFLYHRKKRFELDTKMQVTCFFSGLIAVGAFIAQIIMGLSAMNEYQQIVVAYEEGNYQTVVGEVEKFTTMTSEGKGYETFEIDGVYFSYSDNIIHQGYRNSKTFGGVIKGDGQQLKIGYIETNSENIIVYIEEISPYQGLLYLKNIVPNANHS